MENLTGGTPPVRYLLCVVPCKLYFIADISSFVELHCEIEKILISDKLVDNWTYPLIQPILIEEAKKRGFI